jgi:crotonobetainyl-CoA:carnitine CoA-transferase CaiB-like acyl-CoA transferase
VVVSCRTDGQWAALVRAMGSPPWALDPRFATAAGRVEHADELDVGIEAWTAPRDRYDVMGLLQRSGVPAGVVQDAADRLERDPQLAARGHYTRLGNAEVDELPLEGVPFRMSATPTHTGGRLRRGPPCLGEDNEAVLGELLGMTAEDVAALAAEGVLS